MDCIVETQLNPTTTSSSSSTTRVVLGLPSTPCLPTRNNNNSHHHHEIHLLDPLGLNGQCMNMSYVDVMSDYGDSEGNLENEQEELRELLKQQERELFLLEVSKDQCMQFEHFQKIYLLDLPVDTLLNIFSFLNMNEVIELAPVCRVFKQFYNNDVIWKEFVREKSQYVYNHAAQIAASIDDEELELLFRSNKIQRHHTGHGNISRIQEWNARRRHRKANKKSTQTPASAQTAARTKQKRKLSIHTKNCKYYTALRKRVLMIMKKKEERALVKKEEERRKHYEKVLRSPQKWCERFYICFFTPLFFLVAFACTLCLGLYLDKFMPRADKTVAQRNLALVILPFIVVVVPLYIFASIAATLAEYLRMLRWNAQFDSTFPSIYFGSSWLPLLVCLFALKHFVLPDYIPWRAVIAPQWALSLMYIIVTIVLHMKLSVMKFEVDQKVVYTLMAAINLCVTLTTGFLTAKLDDTLGSNLKYSSFVFSPIWLGLFVALVAIPIGGYAFLHEEGVKLTVLVYIPLTCVLVLPFIAFFIVLGLQLDGILQTYFMAVLSPLYAWQFIWFIVSVGFAIFFVRWCS
jgi:hypothetical protein